jgi:hypothetical protein
MSTIPFKTHDLRRRGGSPELLVLSGQRALEANSTDSQALIKSFLAFRCRLPTSLAVVVPTPVLVPVKSTNYLARVLQQGFPSADAGRCVVSLKLSTADFVAASATPGRYFLLLSLFSPGRHEELEDLDRYIRGEGRFDVMDAKQLLPVFAIELHSGV